MSTEIISTDLKEKFAVVTGASSGIGEACAYALMEEGLTVVNLDIMPQPENGPHYIRCDVSKREDISKASSEIYSKWGVPDILISSAGVGVHEALSTGDPDKWERAIQVNIMGTLRFIRAFTEQMLEKKRGDIVFVSSVAAGKSYTSGGVYSATKIAIERIADTLRMETMPYLRTITIAPGLVKTRFLEAELSGPRDINDWEGLYPAQVADAVLYALRAPQGVAVNNITLRPTAQLF